MTAMMLDVSGHSWLHRLDPRVKLLCVLEGTILLFGWPSLPAALAVLVLCHLLLGSARVPWLRIAQLWRLLLPLTMLVPLLWLPLMPQGSPVLFAWWRITVTQPALMKGLLMAARLDALAFLFFTWLTTTDQRSLVQGFVRLGLPYAWGLTLSLSLRYLPALHTIYSQIVDAQRARGLDPHAGSFFVRARSRLPVLVALLVTALRSSENVGRALEARALGLTATRRATLHPLRLRRLDRIALALLVLIPATILTALLTTRTL